MKAPPSRRHHAGFSLVEVTLALGIAAVGVIAVLGLMPQGMEMSRKTGLITAQRQITEQIARNLDQRKWSELVVQPKVKYYFDDQGLEVQSASPVLTFVVEVEVVQNSMSMSPLGADNEPFLRKVLIRIVNTPDTNFNFDDAQKKKQIVTMVHFIAKNG